MTTLPKGIGIAVFYAQLWLVGCGKGDYACFMQHYPEKARALIANMVKSAEDMPHSAIAFQGAPGAYSHMASMAYDEAAMPLPCFSFADALDAVADRRADRTVIPIENSAHGRVADIHFLLPESGLFIIDEVFLPVRHCLIGRAGAHITQAYSHPQALGQCRKYLRKEGIKPVTFADTAGAVAMVAEQDDDSWAAIGSEMAANHYGLDILARDINDEANNMTRFVVLAREYQAPKGDDAVMTSMIFRVKNIPAALFMALSGFATNGVNMTRLESYITGDGFMAAQFFADIEGMPGNDAVDRALDVLRYHSHEVRILGSYRRGRTRKA